MPRPLIFALLALAACSSEAAGPPAEADLPEPDATPFVPDAGPPDAVPDSVDTGPFTSTGHCDDGTVQLLRVAPWPGGGVQLTLALRTPDGLPAEDGTALPFQVFAGDEEHAASADNAWQTAGITGILLGAGGSAGEQAARIEAARALVAALPEREQVVVWRSIKGLELVSELTTNHDHVALRLEALAAAAGGAPDAFATAAARETLRDVTGPDGPVSRHLVVIAGAAPASAAVVDPTEPVGTLWLVAENATDPVRGVFGWADASPPEAAAALATDMAARRWGIVRVGACTGAAKGAPLELRVGDTACEFEAPEPMEHMADVPCDAKAAAADDYPYGDTVAIELSAEELAIWKARHAASSKDDFRVSVRLGPSAKIPTTAHFRGHTSLDCERKSYTINMDGGEPRRLLPGSANDELYLISMCKDDGFFNQTFANRLQQPLGLFPLAFRYVRLTVNGENHGVYMMLEHPSESLVQDNTDLSAVLRRRFDPEDQVPDVKVPSDDPQSALALYDEVVKVATTAPATGLLSALREVMDIDAYLEWMAFNTLMQNGDTVDEAWFYGAREAGGRVWFRAMGWDPDDLFSACHHASKFAYVDPHGILFCAEGTIDEAILRSPEVYARYIELLEGLIADLGPEKLRYTMDQVRDELWAVLTDDATAAGMVTLVDAHPEAATAEGARAVISGMMDAMLEKAGARRAKLADAISAWRATLP